MYVSHGLIRPPAGSVRLIFPVPNQSDEHWHDARTGLGTGLTLEWLKC
jgi:hypothetical protein